MSAANELTSAQRDDLRTVAAMIIPASDEYKVPGADDPAIQADMLATLGRDTALVAQALDHLARLAGKPLAELDTAKRETQSRTSSAPPAALRRRRSSASSCNATTATTACCARSGSSCARRSRKATRWSRATGRCSIPSRRAAGCDAAGSAR